MDTISIPCLPALSQIRTQGAKLFCFPFAGGGASTYVPWSRYADPAVQIHPVQIPGREGRFREACHESMERLIDSLCRELRPVLTPPFSFFGHSMGGLIAFELTRRLQAENLPLPSRLILSCTRAPQLPRTDAISDLPDQELMTKLRDLNGTSEAVLGNRELMNLLLPRIRSDFRLLESYVFRSGTALPVPITGYWAKEDPEVSECDMELWRSHSSRGFSLVKVAGGHFHLLEGVEAFSRRILGEVRLAGRAEGADHA